MKPIIIFLLAVCVLTLVGCGDRGVEPVPPSPARPDTPTNLRAEITGWATNVAVAIVKVSWEHSGKNVQGFVLSRGNQNSGWMRVATIELPAKSYIDGIVKPGDMSEGVSYLLQAYNEAGLSDTVTCNMATY